MSELAVVDVRLGESEYSDDVWCVVSVNGLEWGKSVPLQSRDEFAIVAPRLQALIEVVYRVAYREGAADSRAAVRAALGITRNTGG